MEKVSNIVTWVSIALDVVTGFIYCLINYLSMLNQKQNIWWVFLIFILTTAIIVALGYFRQVAVSEGGNIVLWGVITLLFVSLPGGILTLLIPPYRPTRYRYGKAAQTETKPKEETEPIDPFVYETLGAESTVEKGDIVKVIKGFYVPSSQRRVAGNDLCEVESVDGSNIVVYVKQPSIVFRVTIDKSNLLLQRDNPDFGKAEGNSIGEKDSDDNQQGQTTDKFVEIRKYKELLDLGIITQEEFENKKKELMI